MGKINISAINQRQKAITIGLIQSLTPWAITKLPDQIRQAINANNMAVNSVLFIWFFVNYVNEGIFALTALKWSISL